MDFSKLSAEDLNEFLSWDYGILLDEGLSLKDQAEQLFKRVSDEGGEFPLPIVDLYLASVYQGSMDQTYTYDQIYNLSPGDIDSFSRVFQFNPKDHDLQTNRDRIFRILTYLGLIDLHQELIQPHIKEYMCENLSLEDLNTYRIANNMHRFDCQIPIYNKYTEETVYLPYLDKENYPVVKAIRDEGVEGGIKTAVEGRNLDLVKYVYENFIPNDFKNSHWEMYIELRNAIKSSMVLAAKNRDWDIVKYLVLKSGYATVPMPQAIIQNDIEMVQFLLDNGAPINGPGDQLGSEADYPLMLAAEEGILDVVKYLVDQGAEIDVSNYHGHTPLMLAVLEGHFDVVKYLVDRGANVNAQVRFPYPGEINHNESIIEFAYKSKVNINEQNRISDYLKRHGAKPGWKVYNEKMSAINPDFVVPKMGIGYLPHQMV